VSNTNINNTLKPLEALYLKGDYDVAIELQKKNGENFSLGQLYYNLGTLNLKKGDAAAGRYYLELAKKHNFNSSMVTHNLSVAKKTLEVKEIGLEENLYNKSINFILETPGASYLTLTLFMTLVTLFFWRVGFVKKRLIIVILFVISAFPICFNHFYLSKIKFAVSLDVMEIYEGPSGIFSKIGSVRPGEKILVGEESNDWVYISYPKSLNGWVNKGKLGFL